MTKIAGKHTPFPVLGTGFKHTDYGAVDLSEEYLRRTHPEVRVYDSLAAYVDQTRAEKKIRVAYGGYLEKRNLYGVSGHFHNEKENRNCHLGVDLWTEAGTPVYTAFEARVHSFGFNNQQLDYGGAIILEYDLKNVQFYALYGHLSLSSLTGLQKNNILSAGFAFATLGDRTENGGWPPHLHLQIILNMEGWTGDYPGVCSEREKTRYAENCPSPLWLCGLGMVD